MKNMEKMRQEITTSWNKALSLDTWQGGPILALHANNFSKNDKLTELAYSTFFVQNNVICKCWQYYFGNKLSPIEHPYALFYWKPLKDIKFAGIEWKDNQSIPEINSHIIGWINSSRYLLNQKNGYSEIPLVELSFRLHFGYFIKSSIFRRKFLYDPGYPKIAWSNIFRWCYVSELFKDGLNEDARKFSLHPGNSVNQIFYNNK